MTSPLKDTYSWFEPLYAKADGDENQVPWALPEAVPYLTQWIARTSADRLEKAGSRQSAVVVGCGLGNDAEALAEAGFEVTAFDVADSAIAWAKQRFPSSNVNYVTADLFDLPSEWKHHFDVVFEFRTLQALPISVRKEAIDQIAVLAKPGGTLLLATYVRDSESVPDGPPWPLSEQELAWIEATGLEKIREERFQKKESRFSDRVQIEYKKPQ